MIDWGKLDEQTDALIARTPAPTPAGDRAVRGGGAAPGFRFASKDRVLDLVTGLEATIAAGYLAAAAPTPVYEILFDTGDHDVRVERQLEPVRPLSAPPLAPKG